MDTLYRLFEAEAVRHASWSKVEGHARWAGVLNGQVRRLRMVSHGDDDARRQLLSALCRKRSTVSSMVEAAAEGQWGLVVRIAHNQVSTYLKEERPLHAVSPDTSGGGTGSDSGGSSGCSGSGGPRGTTRWLSREYETRYVPFDAEPTLLMTYNADIDQVIDLRRAAAKILEQLAHFAVDRPQDAALLEGKLGDDESSDNLERVLGINPGALRQRILVARRRFLEFIGPKQETEWRALVAGSHGTPRSVRR